MSIFKRLTKVGIITSVSALLLPIVTPIYSALAEEEQATPIPVENVISIIGDIEISNQDVFDAIEASGDSIEDHFSAEEIKAALEEDNQQVSMYQLQGSKNFATASIIKGSTGISRVNSNTFNLRLNSLIAKMLIGSGAAVTGAYLLKIPAIATALSKAGLGGTGLVAALGAAAGEVAAFADNGVIIVIRITFVRTNFFTTVRGVYSQGG